MSYLSYRKLPEKLIIRVRRFFKTYYTVRTLFPERSVLGTLPECLRRDVLANMVDPQLRR